MLDGSRVRCEFISAPDLCKTKSKTTQRSRDEDDWNKELMGKVREMEEEIVEKVQDRAERRVNDSKYLKKWLELQIGRAHV